MGYRCSGDIPTPRRPNASDSHVSAGLFIFRRRKGLGLLRCFPARTSTVQPARCQQPAKKRPGREALEWNTIEVRLHHKFDGIVWAGIAVLQIPMANR